MTPENEVRSSATPLEERIREYAHQLWQWRLENHIAGDALSDWLEAEYQIHKLTPAFSAQSPSVDTPKESL